MSPTSSSKTQRLADGTVEVVAIPPKDIFATLVLTHEAVKEHEATLSVPPPSPPGPVVDKGVVSFTVNAIPTPPGGGAKTFNYPFDQKGTGGIPFDAMDLEIVDGELSGSIQMGAAFGEAVSCDLTMQGTDGNWSGQWQCFFGFSEELFAFTAIPFRVEPGHEHDKVSER